MLPLILGSNGISNGEKRIELTAQNSFVRRLQHKAAAKEGVSSLSVGEGASRRVVLEKVWWFMSLLISIEGFDGVGKSTQAKLLKKNLDLINIKSICVREPGGTELAEKIISFYS